jgi:polyferredoxin
MHEFARPAAREKKAFMRRRGDGSQQVRLAVQLAFMAVTLWVAAQFILWVRYYESGGTTLRVARPSGVEAWLPIAALMNLKAFVLTRTVPEIHAAGMFMLIAFVAISWLYRKAFCSWICPVGTISEWLWQGGEAILGRTFALPRWADVPLRSLKYVLFGLFAYVVIAMPVPEIRAFLTSPYGLVADVKMLNFFRFMGQTAAVVILLLVVLSVFVKNFWCRYLCPYGALHGLASWLSPVRIRRDAELCIDCAKCARACPSRLPVDAKASVASPECTGCLECVAVCPVKDALELSPRRRAGLPAWAVAAGIAAVFLGLTALARLTGHWHTEVDPRVYQVVIPRAAELDHPR